MSCGFLAAAPVTVTVTGTLQLVSGPDGLFLNGQNFNLAISNLDSNTVPVTISTTSATYGGATITLNSFLTCQSALSPTITLSKNSDGSGSLGLANCTVSVPIIATQVPITATVNVATLPSIVPSALNPTAIVSGTVNYSGPRGTTILNIVASSAVPPVQPQISATGPNPPLLGSNPPVVALSGAPSSGVYSQQITLTSTGPSFPYSATVTTTPPGLTWLTATPLNANGLGSVTVSADSAGLAPGTYNGSIVVNAGGAANEPFSIPVSFVVTAVPVNLTLNPANLSFSGISGGSQTSAQQVSVGSSGGSVAYTVSSSVPWLSTVPTGGSTPSVLNVSADPSGLAAGTYTGTISVIAPGANNSPQSVGVTFTVAPAGITVNPNPVPVFRYTIGAANGPVQTVTVTTPVPGASFTAFAGSSLNWLQVTPVSGTTPATLTLSGIAPALTQPGVYSGQLQITSPGAPNSPLTIRLTALVSARPVTVSPATLPQFRFTLGGTLPAVQSVNVTANPLGSSFNATPSASWITVSPASGNAPASVNIGVDPTGLATGTYNGSVTFVNPANPSVPFVLPVSLAVAGNSQIALTPRLFPPFAFQIGRSAPTPYSVAITSNPTGAQLGVTTTGGAWLTAALSATTAPATLVISANPTGLAAGNYTGTVNVTSTTAVNGNISIPISLQVSASPLISSNALQVFFVQPNGTTGFRQMLNVRSTDGSALPITAAGSSGASWLTTQALQNSTPAQVIVGVDTAQVSPGPYIANVVVKSTGIGNSPYNVPVIVIVVSPAPAKPAAAGVEVTAVLSRASLEPGLIAPGQLLTLRGSGFGDSPEVIIGGERAMVLSTGEDSVDVLVPQSVAGLDSVTLEVRADRSRSEVIPMSVIEATPGVLGETRDERSPRRVYNADGTRNEAGRGAEAGSLVTVYTTGAGLESAARGDEERSAFRAPLRLSLNGVTAELVDARRVAGEPGVEKIVLRVPAGLEPGAYSLAIEAAGRVLQPGVALEVR